MAREDNLESKRESGALGERFEEQGEERGGVFIWVELGML